MDSEKELELLETIENLDFPKFDSRKLSRETGRLLREQEKAKGGLRNISMNLYKKVLVEQWGTGKADLYMQLRKGNGSIMFSNNCLS